jgi:hypothetical protein
MLTKSVVQTNKHTATERLSIGCSVKKSHDENGKIKLKIFKYMSRMSGNTSTSDNN